MPIDRTRSLRGWKWPAILVALLLVYAVAGFFGVPWLVQTIARDQVTQLGRKLDLGEVRFNPFTFELNLAGVRLTEADGSPLLGFDALYLNADVLGSIWQRGLILQAVRWSAPEVDVVISADGSINLSKLIPPSSQPAQPKPAGPPPRIRIGELSIENGRVSIDDRSRPKPLSVVLNPIEFSLKDFRTDSGHENAVAFSATAATGEELEWSGDFSVQPVSSSGRFALRKLHASTIARYLQDRLPVRLTSGVAELNGDYRLAMDSAPSQAESGSESPALSLDLHLPAIIVRDLALAGSGDAGAPLSIAELALRELNLSLAKREVVLQRVEIKGLRADLQRDADGSVNLTRLYKAPDPAPDPVPATGPTMPTAPAASSASVTPPVSPPTSEAKTVPWHVAVNSIELGAGDVEVEDLSVVPAVRLALNPITIRLNGFSTDPTAVLKLDAAIAIDHDAHLNAQGDIGLQPLSVRLALDLQGYDLSVLQPYLATRTGVNLKSGQLAVKGNLSYVQKPAATPALDFTGEVSVSKFDLEDRALKQGLLGWRELQLAGIAYHSAPAGSTPAGLSIDRINLLEPSARVVISETREINLASALAAPDQPAKTSTASTTAAPLPTPEKAPDPAAAAKSSSPPMPIRIQDVHVDKGQLRFTDLSISPQFSAGIFALGGDITDLSSDASVRAKIHLTGKVDQFSPVLISGQMIPSQFAKDTDIAMSFHNMDLVRFNPYSGRFAGYNIVKGKLTTDLHYKIHDRLLDAEHHVVLDQLEFGDATGSKDAVPLPVKLAVALLKDRNGVIDLSLPVQGSLDDPAFDVGAMVGKVLVNLLEKAVTSPFSALASLIGGGEELAYVEFAAGAAELSPAEAAKLGQLARALIERPQLSLDVPLARADPQDGQALARSELDRRIPAGPPGTAPAATQKNRLRALESLYVQLMGTAPAYPEPVSSASAAASDDPVSRHVDYLESVLLQKLTPDASALQHLATERARRVQAAVLANAEIKPERVFLTARRASSVSDSGVVRMQLSLE